MALVECVLAEVVHHCFSGVLCFGSHSRKICTFFEEHGLMVLEWPGNSPDINPIENLWAIIKRRLQKEDCSTMQKMISAVIKVWYHDEELAEMCSNLVESML